MDASLWKVVSEYGLATGIFLLLFFIIKWILEEVKKILEREAKERSEWAGIIQGFQRGLLEHTANAQAFHDEVKEAHRYQREEHLKLAELQDTTCRNMKEIEQALGRLNGYVK